MDKIQPKEKQMQIELTPEVAGGTYANLAIISHTDQEFVVDFIAALPGVPKARVQSRILLTPENAKRLLFALQDNVVKYEKIFGDIQPKQPKQPEAEGGLTATPFGIPEGKA